jgi:hypothetical protein
VLSQIHPALGGGAEGETQFYGDRCADEAHAIASGEAGHTVEAVEEFVAESGSPLVAGTAVVGGLRSAWFPAMIR